MKAISLILVLSLVFIIGCEKKNILPTCEIISPGNDAEFDVGELITISVDAADEDGTIAEVRFYIEYNCIFTASDFPFNYEWNSELEEAGIKKIRVSVTDDNGGTIDDEISIWLNPGGGETRTLTDIDGNVYETVSIGKKRWMAENLKVTHYPDGSAIPLVTDNIAWADLADTNTDNAYCYYNNDSSSVYGALYTYAAALNACPAGWHLPTDAEWTELENFLADNGYNYDCTIGGGGNKIGKAMASASGWSSSGTVGSVASSDYPGKRNASGFSALPGGYRTDYDGAFHYAGDIGYWWSSTELTSIYAFNRRLYWSRTKLYENFYNKSTGFSVRYVRDD